MKNFLFTLMIISIVVLYPYTTGRFIDYIYPSPNLEKISFMEYWSTGFLFCGIGIFLMVFIPPVIKTFNNKIK